MPILPFNDRPYVNINYISDISVNGSNGINTSEIDMFRQGINVKTNKYFCDRILPIIGSKALPARQNDLIDFSIERTTYGYVDLFIESNNDKTVAPFDDISSLNNPVSFLKDSGITAYPQVMLSPHWLDPGAMNGIIEPLSVRGTIPGASIESPFVYNTIKADVTETSYLVEAYILFESAKSTIFDITSPFIDSQDLSFVTDSVIISDAGISDFGPGTLSPFMGDTSVFIIKNDLKSMTSSDFNDCVGLGIIRTGTPHGFVYSSEKSVSLYESGIRNVCGVDSLAFGGLLK